MKMYRRKNLYHGNFEITKREILASISIVAIMLLIGVFIAGKISDYQLDKNEKYNKAVKIETQELFEYGMRTNVGDAFVYGRLEAIDTVTYPELDGEYMYIEKIKELYTEHTEIVYEYDENGNVIDSHENSYWTWDRVNSEKRSCREISFLGHAFPSDKIRLPSVNYVGTIKESSYVRYKYYGVGTKFTGTIFTELKENTITDNSSFYQNMTIEETVEYLEINFIIWVFWVFWVILIGACVCGFYYIDNKWLE